MKLLSVNARLQLVLEQNPADACPGKKSHSNPDIAMIIRARAAFAEALGQIVRMAYTVAYLSQKAIPVNGRAPKSLHATSDSALPRRQKLKVQLNS
ncbi:MAG: hypothetical protein AB7H71_11140 [Alphaproteobacteria bacterium]